MQYIFFLIEIHAMYIYIYIYIYIFILISFRMKKNCNQLQKGDSSRVFICHKEKEIKSRGKLGPALECFYAKKEIKTRGNLVV